MKRLLLCASMLVLAAVPAAAQVAVQEAVATIPAKLATYQVAIPALAPAASGTDIVTIIGSATKTIRVEHVECNGTSTASATIPVYIIKRSTADLTGTSTTPAILPMDSNDGAATAVVNAYTANPGTLGTLTANVYVGMLNTVTTAATAVPPTPNFSVDFGGLNQKPITLRGVTQLMAISLNGVSATAGASLNCTLRWTEAGY